MDLQNEKCVMVIDENLSLGLIANTAAIMGITLGKKMPEVVGADVADRSGNEHLGIIEFPVPILRGPTEGIKAIRERLYQPEFLDLTVVDFSDLAQGCKTYDEFIEKMGHADESSLQYFGVAICGAKKKVNKITGNLPLLTASAMDDFDKRDLDNYRAADTAGLLVRLPVPLGSEVWQVCNKPAWNSGVGSAEMFLIGEIQTPCSIVQPTKFTVGMMGEWGISVFPTEADARKTL